jgi:uncharacterized membrane protein
MEGNILAPPLPHRLCARTVPRPNRFFHLAYVATIAFKGVDGALETLLGAAIALSGGARFHAWLLAFAAPELTEPDNGFVHLLRAGAAQLLGSSAGFLVIYLLAHGLLKLALALVLLTGRGRWVYPVASVILLAFLAFMSWHLAEHWSNWVFAFAMFDLATLLLVLNEWRNEKTQHLRHQPLL